MAVFSGMLKHFLSNISIFEKFNIKRNEKDKH